jgi:hypothetical protein
MKLRRFVVGRGILVEEDEGVDLAGGEMQVVARVLALTAGVVERHLELVPGLGEDGEGIVGPLGLGLEGHRVRRAGVGRPQADAVALAEADVGEDLALVVAHRAERAGSTVRRRRGSCCATGARRRRR